MVRWDHYARLIAGRTEEIRVMDAHGRYRARPWPEEEPERPYAVHLATKRGAARVLALDFDAHKGDAAADAATLRFLLSEVGASFIETASGPTGGIHVFVPFQEPLEFPAVRAIAEALSLRLPSLDVSMLLNRHTGAIRPPNAPHRLGGRSTLHGDDERATQLLRSGNTLQVALDLVNVLDIDERVLRPSRPPLSPALFRMLHSGEGLENYESLSEAVLALATSVLARGHDAGWLRSVLQDQRHELARQLLDHRRRDGTKRNSLRLVEQAIRKARDFVAASPSITTKEEAREAIAAIEQDAAKHPWAGRSMLTARAVLHAHLHIADNCGGVEYNASQRQLCELSSVHTRRTVENANRLLVQLGYLRLVRHGEVKYASTWRLSHPQRSLPEVAEFHPARLGHPLFAWRQLGKAAAQVVRAIEEGHSTPLQIAAVTNLHVGTVRRSLHRLAHLEVPLVERHGRVWQLCNIEHLDDQVDEVAHIYGAFLSHADLVLRHEQERNIWRRWLELSRLGPAPPAVAAA